MDINDISCKSIQQHLLNHTHKPSENNQLNVGLPQASNNLLFDFRFQFRSKFTRLNKMGGDMKFSRQLEYARVFNVANHDACFSLHTPLVDPFHNSPKI